MNYQPTPEVVLCGIDSDDLQIPELNVTYTRASGKIFTGSIRKAEDVAAFLKSTFGKDEIELQEQFIVLYLNQHCDIIGYYRHSKGSINATVADTRIVLGAALKCAAVHIVVAHNHPSGNLTPSEADRVLTEKLKEGAKHVDIRLLDHLILSKGSYYSFADNGLLGLSGLSSLKPPATPNDYVQKMLADLTAGVHHNKRSTEKLAAAFGIEDKTAVKEMTELAIVERARALAHAPGSTYDRYQSIVDLYNTQANLSHRTSNSILLQQYSTPAPIAYLAGVFAGLNAERLFHLHSKDFEAFEPSAGNGLLTIAGLPNFCRVNEIDELRRSNLILQGYREVTGQDASQPFPMHYFRRFDAILTNPPFGTVDIKIDYDGYKISSLEQLMALRALDCMADTGRAAIIVGGHTTWDELGRIQAGKNRIFFNYLYSHYKVEDVINIDGHKLYSRQGTAFDVRLILISGRRTTVSGAAPLHNPGYDLVVSDFEALYRRVSIALSDIEPVRRISQPANTTDMAIAKARALALELEMDMDNEGLGSAFNWNKLGIPEPVFPEALRNQPWVANNLTPASQKVHYGNGYRLGYKHLLMFATSNDRQKIRKIADKEKRAAFGKLGAYEILVSEYGYDRGVWDAEKYYLSIQEGDGLEGYKGTQRRFSILRKQSGKKGIISILGLKLYFNLEGSNDFDDQDLYQYALDAEVGHEWESRDIKLVCLDDGCVNEEDGSWDELGMAYTPASDVGKNLQTQVPDSMGYETHEALKFIQEEVGGDVDNFVRDRLGYATLSELADVLSGEQIDAVAMAIYNIEGRSQGMIIGDQTGIGKGRVAAAIIRYSCKQGIRPIFLTEKPNLFSDIYRDLKAIGSADLVPFIVNGKESKTDIKDEDGNIIYTALTPPEQQTIFESRILPGRFNFVLGTYSQFNSPENKPVKPRFLQAIAAGCIMILDEAHNSSGSSNTGAYLKGVVKSTQGVVFLSATFAKRPDNMPIYAMKTAMADCALSDEDLVAAIEKGGVALQEVISSQLVSEGQMLRRERSYEAIEVNYLTMEDKAEEHKATADVVTSIIRRIIAFQIEHVAPAVKTMDKIMAAESKETEVRKGTESAGVDNTPYFSKVFNVINQMLFAIKAEAVADRAIERLREGKKPVIAFSSTMGAFLETMENERGLPVADGDIIKADFSEVLKRGIDGVMKITVKDERGNASYERLPLNELAPDGIKEYESILADIGKVSTGLCLSPIDILIDRIEAAGYTVSEVTGRKMGLRMATKTDSRFDRERGADLRKDIALSNMTLPDHRLNGLGVADTSWRAMNPGSLRPERLDYRMPLAGMVYQRKRENTNDAFRRFNNNEVDVLLINQSGSTGASAHAIPTSKVPPNEVRQRVMIVLQAELDINTEVQKRGRINRTGQILKPLYDYLNSAIPAEQRLMMMLQKKLKSLDANTSSNQKQSASMLDVPDFLNKYGDKVVKEFLMDNPEMNTLLDDPLKIKDSGDDGKKEKDDVENAAQKVSGRVAVLSTEMQKVFYDDITSRYNDLVGYLKQAGEYDLELEAMNLQAETINSSVISVGSGGGSPFGENVNLELVDSNVLRKPYTPSELMNILTEALGGQDAKAQQKAIEEEFRQWHTDKLKNEMAALSAKYERLLAEVPEHKKVQGAKSEAQRQVIMRELEAAIHEASDAATKKAIQKSKNIEQALSQHFSFFYVGRVCSYPIATMGMGTENIPTVFLGFSIDRRKPNPFAPSAVKLRFAIANGMKYLELPASMGEQISPIVAASFRTPQYSMDELMRAWEKAVSGAQAARKRRYVITGNLLQALGRFKGGRLIDYTTLKGGSEKGLMMPDGWTPKDQDNGVKTVSVPLSKAVGVIKSIPVGTNKRCTNGLTIMREFSGRFKFFITSSRQRGGDIYMDQDIWKLVDKGQWESVSAEMVSTLQPERLDEFLAIMGDKHPGTIEVQDYQMAQVNTGGSGSTQRRHYAVRLPEPAPAETAFSKHDQAQMDKADGLRIRALAIELEMEMEMENETA